MRSICLFSSYFDSPDIPYYVKFYLEQLSQNFTKIIFVTNEKILNNSSCEYLNDNNIECLQVVNEGYDFGMWYKAIQKIDLTIYQRVGFVNDSCILFSSLNRVMKWGEQGGLDFWGISESNSISRHIQSYFLIVEKNAISSVVNYFNQSGIRKEIKDVILTYEIGLSKFLLELNFKMGAFLDNENYKGEFSPYYKLIDSHIKQGTPLIKKKIIFQSYRKDELRTLARMNFNISPDYYISMIMTQNANLVLIDFEKVKQEVQRRLGSIELFLYNLKRHLIRIARPSYKLIIGTR